MPQPTYIGRATPTRIDQLVYPILKFAQDGSLTPERSPCWRATRRALRRGYFAGLLIVDSDGGEYRVASAHETRPRLLLARLKGRLLGGLIEVRCDIVRERSIPLGELRERISQYVTANLELWESGGDVAELLSEVAAARNYREVIEALMRGAGARGSSRGRARHLS